MQMSRGFLLGAVGITVFSCFFPACGRKKAEPVSREQQKKTAVEALMKESSLKLYPGADLIDQAVKSDKTQVPGTDKAGAAHEIVVGMVLGVSGEDFDKVRGYYAAQTPHVITEEKVNGAVRFLQLCNVPDINKAVSEQASPILLVNLRRRILAEGERLAYQNEYQQLKSVPKPDKVQSRRAQELERLLREKTFIQLNIRKLV